MKKLSEISNDDFIAVERKHGSFYFMTKEEYITYKNEYKGQRIYSTTEYQAQIDAKSMLLDEIERESENMYEDWEYYVEKDITEEDIKDIQVVLDRILKGHISYYLDQLLENDEEDANNEN